MAIELDSRLLVAALVVYIVWRVVSILTRRGSEPVAEPVQIGEITLASLGMYDGRDPFRPILLAVKGKVYDVTDGRDFYGPGGGYHLFSGRECSRALAKMNISEKDCNDNLEDCSEEELNTLNGWIEKFEQKYPVVGKVVPLKELTLDDLHAFDGSDPEKPMYLAIRGTIFDVSNAKQFYGPDGMYPFAGHECARAFALYSTELKDCNANLEGLEVMEIDALNDWEAKFVSKYDIVGKVVKEN